MGVGAPELSADRGEIEVAFAGAGAFLLKEAVRSEAKRRARRMGQDRVAAQALLATGATANFNRAPVILRASGAVASSQTLRTGIGGVVAAITVVPELIDWALDQEFGNTETLDGHGVGVARRGERVVIYPRGLFPELPLVEAERSIALSGNGFDSYVYRPTGEESFKVAAVRIRGEDGESRWVVAGNDEIELVFEAPSEPNAPRVDVLQHLAARGELDPEVPRPLRIPDPDIYTPGFDTDDLGRKMSERPGWIDRDGAFVERVSEEHLVVINHLGQVVDDAGTPRLRRHALPKGTAVASTNEGKGGTSSAGAKDDKDPNADEDDPLDEDFFQLATVLLSLSPSEVELLRAASDWNLQLQELMDFLWEQEERGARLVLQGRLEGLDLAQALGAARARITAEPEPPGPLHAVPMPDVVRERPSSRGLSSESRTPSYVHDSLDTDRWMNTARARHLSGLPIEEEPELSKANPYVWKSSGYPILYRYDRRSRRYRRVDGSASYTEKEWMQLLYEAEHDPRKLEQVVQMFFGMVVHRQGQALARYAPNHLVAADDVVQDGLEGLMKGIRRLWRSTETRSGRTPAQVRSFLVTYIDGAIVNGLRQRRESGPPRNTAADVLLPKVLRASRRLMLEVPGFDSLPRHEVAGLIAAELEVTPQEVMDSLVQLVDRGPYKEEEVVDEHGVPADDDESLSPHARRRLSVLLSESLKAREERAIRLYYGLTRLSSPLRPDRVTLGTVGDELGVTRERARQIIDRALRRLRAKGRLREFARIFQVPVDELEQLAVAPTATRDEGEGPAADAAVPGARVEETGRPPDSEPESPAEKLEKNLEPETPNRGKRPWWRLGF